MTGRWRRAPLDPTVYIVPVEDADEMLRLLESAAFRFEYISTKPFEDNDIGHCEYMVNEIRAFLASRTGGR